MFSKNYGKHIHIHSLRFQGKIMKKNKCLKVRVSGIVMFIAVMAINGFCANTLTVNPGEAKTVINKTIYSGLIEMLGRCVTNGIYVGTSSSVPNVHGIRKDIIKGFKEAGIEGLQWPGGCAANSYNWASIASSTTDFGTDRFMELCDSVGCEPYITSPGYSTSASSNLSWAKYLNNNSSHSNWAVKYWKVGNEVWGCGGSQGSSTYAANYLANYDSLKQSINGKSLYLVAGNGLIGIWSWLDTLLPQIDGKASGIELHDYLYYPYGTSQVIPCVTFSDSQYYTIVYEAINRISGNIATAITYLDKYDKDTSIMIMEDEWGDWLLALDYSSDNYFQQNTVMDMLSSAIQLHTFMKYSYRVQLAAVAQVVNVIHSLMLTRTTDSALVKTPTFYLFKMYKPHHTANAKWVPTTLSSDNITKYGKTMNPLSAAASVDSLGHLNISVCNVDLTNSNSLAITINSDTTYTIDTAQIITGSAKNTYNDFAKTENVNIQPFASSNYTLSGKTLTVTVPAISTIMIILKSKTISGVGLKRTQSNVAGNFYFNGSNGKLTITSSENINTPLSINIYGIDGRTLIDRLPGNFHAGKSLCVPVKNINCKGVYIIKIEGEGVNFSKKVAFTR
jgi:alpha-L-arabinofuranosidase